MKKIGIMASIILLISCLSSSSIANPNVSYTPPVKILIDGYYVKSDGLAEFYGNALYLPLQVISSHLGANVTIDQNAEKMTISHKNIQLSFTFNSKTALWNGERITLPKHYIKNGQVMVPHSFIRTLFGASIEWQSATKTAAILSPEVGKLPKSTVISDQTIASLLDLNLFLQQHPFETLTAEEQKVIKRVRKEWAKETPFLMLGEKVFSKDGIFIEELSPANRPIKLMMVPLDSRPANVYYPVKIGALSGFSVMTPPNDWLGDLHEEGNTVLIKDWMKQFAHEAAGFIISIDMLAYGGLVPSRSYNHSLEEVYENLAVIKELKKTYPDKPIYVYDSIQRLTVTINSKYSQKDYSRVREWAQLYDRVYHFNERNDRERLKELETLIPTELLADYQKARKRNHEINKLMIDLLDEGTIDYLILSQDDAAEYGFHRIESEQLQQKLAELGIEEDRAVIFPGTDEIDMVLLSRFSSKFYKISPNYFISYSGTHGEDYLPEYEDIMLDENINRHIIASGGTITTNRDKANIQLMVHTPPIKEKDRVNSVQLFIDEIKSLTNLGIPTAVIDASTFTAEPLFTKKLLEEIDFPQLYGYSAWNTMGNRIGIAIGQASPRFAFMNNQTALFDSDVFKEATKHQAEFLLSRISTDWDYKSNTIKQLRQFAKSIGANGDDLQEDYPIVKRFTLRFMEDMVKQRGAENFDNKRIPHFIKDGNVYYKTISTYEDAFIDLPWKRDFDIAIYPKVTMKNNEEVNLIK
ncbi:DUF4127 family protein [Bacillus taeanensis]|uniref:Copper amine oxidase-like N-terminal domain-containing protein n=1 Tax=Bacillus taeanensis TaxID=273032 RepID=A0A366XR54_9BACI|nr:DUF4127 family protein [Bacillus taeanensis]RBW67605.1 hypothetical protein DS031_21280 [Bacillus taeanensis]